MYRFYVEKDQIGETTIHLKGTDVNHVKNVLRMGKGDKLIISNGQKTDYHCIIEDVDLKEITLRIQDRKETDTELPCKVTIFQAVPKKDKMEFFIQKAVELGAYEIVPMFTKRCVVKWEDEKKVTAKTKRWQAIAEAAAKQSVRGILPKVGKPITWKEALDRVVGFDMGVLPYELAGETGVDMETSRNILEEAGRKQSICVFIGPEGGFEDEEVKEALQKGLRMVSLGKRILRTETAGMVVLAYMMVRMG